MAKYKGKYRSESHRLKGWDYSREAIYFITFCVQDFECLFGEVIADNVDAHRRAYPKNNEIQNNEIHDGESVRAYKNNEIQNNVDTHRRVSEKEMHDGASVRMHNESARMNLNQFGQIVEDEIQKSIEIRKNWIFHEWVVMPNHVHMLIEIELNDNNTVNTHSRAYQNQNEIHNNTIHDGESLQQLRRMPNSISSFIGIFKTVVTKQINELRNTKGERIWQRNYHDHIVRNYQSFEKIGNYIEQNPQRWYEDRFNPIKPNLTKK